jgi:hypothetical protein
MRIRRGHRRFFLSTEGTVPALTTPAEYPRNGGLGPANENPLSVTVSRERAVLEPAGADPRRDPCERTIRAERAAAAPPVPPGPPSRSPGRGLLGARLGLAGAPLEG